MLFSLSHKLHYSIIITLKIIFRYSKFIIKYIYVFFSIISLNRYLTYNNIIIYISNSTLTNIYQTLDRKFLFRAKDSTAHF